MKPFEPLTNRIDQTPPSLCKKIISLFQWDFLETVLEPAMGEGAFYYNLPPQVEKFWCEIEHGQDFFQWWQPVQTIITNPPYNQTKGGRNLVIPFLEHSFEVATRRIMFLLNLKTFNTMKPNRLHKYRDWGWAMTRLNIFTIKKWSGLYFLLTFHKGGRWCVEWDGTNYE